MRNLLVLILFGCVLISCNDSQTKSLKADDRLELVPEPDKQERLLGEAIQKLRTTNCDFSAPDTSLCGITLNDQKSAEKVIGVDNNTDKRDQYRFYSIKGSETLSLTQHPGNVKNQISIFSVSYSDKKSLGYKQLNVATFQTEKGIKLGLTKEQVVAKLGSCYAIVDSANECIEIYYRIEIPNDSKTKILERNNMPIYYASYNFCENKLRYFEFGFEYP
jgi:hypothetical protein